jgi:Ca2+-binding RTX toxin-like protein
VVVAGAGDDQVNVGQGTHQLFGGEGNDTVSFGDLTEGMTIDLRAGQASGNGVAATLSGFENVIGSQGNDRIVGDSRTNLLDGGAGDDVLQAGSSDDVLLGGEGNDTLYGEAGFDRLDGGAGDDRLHADQFDEVMGGEGYDRVLYDQAQVGVTLDMGAAGIEEVNAGSRFADTFIGGEGDDRVYARQGDDLVFGGAGNDQLNGQEGNDTLVGGEGNDTLDGGVGDDLLMGGSGSNRLIGGEGIDTVWYGDAASGVTVDLTLGRATHDGAADVLSGIERVVGSEHDDTFRFERPMNGASYDVFAGAGHNVLDLSRFTTDQLTIEPGKVIVNFAAGQSFSITHHGIEQIVTASGTMENINVQSLEMLAFPGEATVSGDVLLGAFDIDGDQLSVSAFTQPANGKVSFDGAGRFTYQPASGFFGVDRFSFTVSDPAGHQVTRFIDVTVPAPIAGVDFVQDDESGATNKSSSGSSSSTDSTLRGSTSLSNQGSSDSQTVGSQTSDSNDVVLGSSLGAADNGAAAGGSGDGDSGSRLTESTEELERLLVELADSDNLLQEAGVPLGVEQLASLLASLEDLHPGALETLANLDSAEMADRLAQDPQLSEALSSMGDRSEFAMQAIVGTLGGMLMGFVGLRKPKEESEERGPKKVTRTSGDQK